MGYFKFLKIIIIYMAIFSVLALPSVIFYVSARRDSKNISYNFIDMISYTTLGSLG